MKIETLVFGLGVAFFATVATVYGVVTGWGEPVGATGLYLASGLAALIAGYLLVTSQRIDPRPEDDPDAEIAVGAGEIGSFAPYSWWPLPLGLASAAIFAGLAVGLWLSLIGVGFGAIALWGWVFEYYRGEHTH